jgi:hypothetical protein
LEEGLDGCPNGVFWRRISNCMTFRPGLYVFREILVFARFSHLSADVIEEDEDGIGEGLCWPEPYNYCGR